jgi:malonyl-CoA decarboxylase
MSMFADLLSTVFERRTRWLSWGGADDRCAENLTQALVGNTGEMSGLALASRILDLYQAMEDAEKIGFFRHLAGAMTVDTDAVRTALDAFETGQTKASYRALMAAAEPPRQELIRRLNQVPNGTKQLVRMRADLLRLGRGDDELMALDLDFRHLFASWFNRGFLVLRPINWNTPAAILEKIIAYEAVHAIDSWDDLRRRLAPDDRRCFAFFHPAMPDEPLIFVEVALTQGVAKSIQTVLAEGRDALLANEADTAVFYSISNCQNGLASISFGNSLIKQVVADLSAELPTLNTFVTLSPIPGFSAWLDEINQRDVATEDPSQARMLAAHYLTQERRKNGAPRDPVARFHLGNGALVHAVHSLGDTSDKGMTQSAGTMVNYLYALDKVETNHEGYATNHTIAASNEVTTLASAVKINQITSNSTA